MPRSIVVASYLTIATPAGVDLVLVAIAATPVLPWLIGVVSLGVVSTALVVFSERKLGRDHVHRVGVLVTMLHELRRPD